MSVLINADTSDGLKFTSDTSGEIKLQSAGADIVSVTANGMAVDTNTLYVDATNNNVGIGTSAFAFANRLNVKQSADNTAAGLGARIERNANDSSLFLGYRDNSDSWQINASYSSTGAFKPITFHTSDAERMRIDSSGNVSLTNGIIHGGGGGINMATSRLLPTNSSGNVNDNANDLGGPSNRFDDVYATSGTVNTSDENEKQSIQSLTASEMAVAKRISKLFKTYKWNSSVESKGSNARIHVGVIAQDVQQAFSDEGLNANNYGLFCSDTWWEKEITEDDKSYIDYKDEETEGYVEKTRLGVRYPELLSFVNAYHEQKLNDLETRIQALENA